MKASNAKEFLPFINALIEGKVIQIRVDGGWLDLGEISFNRNPSEYRVKPDNPWYRVALIRVCGAANTTSVDCEEREKNMERMGYFLKWLTDRVEY